MNALVVACERLDNALVVAWERLDECTMCINLAL